VGQTTGELKAQAEDQRAALSRDLEAVGDRLSPGRMVERRRAAVRERFTSVRTAVMGTADSATSSVRDTAGSAATATRETAGSVREAAGSTVDTLQQMPRAAGEAVVQRTEGNPLAAGLVAFGAGLLAATLLPPSSRERELAARAEPGLRNAVDELKSEAQQAVDELKPVAQQAVEQVKSDVQQAADSVKDEARSSADSFKEKASDAAESVKQDATASRDEGGEVSGSAPLP
jgi:gas vesicle protein